MDDSKTYFRMTVVVRADQERRIRILQKRGMGPTEVVRRALDEWFKNNPVEEVDDGTSGN